MMILRTTALPDCSLRVDVAGGCWFWKWEGQAVGKGNVWRWQPSGYRCSMATESQLLSHWLAWQAKQQETLARLERRQDEPPPIA